jgi:hypothetical protein
MDVMPPRLIQRSQQRPGRITPGDWCEVDEGPQLLQFLMRPYAGATHPLGRGIHPMTTVPLGLAIDAAIKAVDGEVNGVSVLRFCEFSMENFTSNRRPLRARATVKAIGRRHVRVEAQVWEDDRLILRGEIGLVKVRGGRAIELHELTLG